MTNFPDNIIALTFHYNEGALLPLTDCVTGSCNPLFAIEKHGIRVKMNLCTLPSLPLPAGVQSDSYYKTRRDSRILRSLAPGFRFSRPVYRFFLLLPNTKVHSAANISVPSRKRSAHFSAPLVLALREDAYSEKKKKRVAHVTSRTARWWEIMTLGRNYNGASGPFKTIRTVYERRS